MFLNKIKMMTEKQKRIYVTIGIAVVLWIAILIGVIVHIVPTGDGMTLGKLDDIIDQVRYKKEMAWKNIGDGPCGPDCLMKQSDVEKKIGVSKGTCVYLCWNGRENIIDTGNENCMTYTGSVCKYSRKIGRRYGVIITVKYTSWEGEWRAESMDWEKNRD